MNQRRTSSKSIPSGDHGRAWPSVGMPQWGHQSVWQANRRQNRPYQVTFAANLGRVEGHHGGVAAQRDWGVDDDSATKRKRVEAILLLSKSPLTTRKLAQLAHLADATEARTLVRDLNQTYDRLGRALRIELVAGGYRMLTRGTLAPWLAKLGYLPPPVRLSSPMMETLSVVAYRQNVSRADIEAVRGVACGELLRQLMERDLVRIAGRSEELGRPYLYGTTKRFLQLFGLPSVTALPPIRWQMLRDESSPDDSTKNDFDSTNDDLPKSTKEPVVITSVAPVLSEAGSALTSADLEIHPIVTAVDQDHYLDTPHQSAIDLMSGLAVVDSEPSRQASDVRSVIEDEEDDLYGDSDEDDEIDDEIDDDVDDDDWDDEEDDDEDEDEDVMDDEDEEDDLVEDDDWEEVEDDDDAEDDEIEDEEWEDDDEEDEEWDDDEEEEEEEEEEDWE